MFIFAEFQKSMGVMFMVRIDRYLQILTWVSGFGTKLIDLEKKIMEEYGVSYRQASRYIANLRKMGLVVYRKPYRRSKHIYVYPSKQAKIWILEITREWKL